VTRLLLRPVRIEVVTDEDGRPRSFTWGNNSEEVVAICNIWRVDADWWKRRRIARVYYKVETGEGLLCDLYLDETGGEWYLARIYD